MIIINSVFGLLCNRLFLFAHLLAYGASTGQRVWFPGFKENEDQFDYFTHDRESWSEHVYLPFSAKGAQEMAERSLRRLCHKDSKALRFVEAVMQRKLHVSLDYMTETLYPEAGNDGHLTVPLCFFEGWAFRVPLAFGRFAPQLRSIFRYQAADIRQAKVWLESRPAPITIGVHIRHGDYAEGAPQWYYSHAQYLRWMSELRRELGSQVGFVVVSNGELPDFNENWIASHRGNAVQDLCVLSHCDRIMGPPSTYNRWAAFMGEKKHLCLWDDKQSVKAGDFADFKMTADTKNPLTPQDIESMRWFGIA